MTDAEAPAASSATPWGRLLDVAASLERRVERIDPRLRATAAVAASLAAALALTFEAGSVTVVVAALVVGGRRGWVVALALGVAACRWGTTEIAAIAGDQAVLGPAVGTGGAVVVASSVVTAVAVVAVAVADRGPAAATVAVSRAVVAAWCLTGRAFVSAPVGRLASVLGVVAMVLIARRWVRDRALSASLRPLVAASGLVMVVLAVVVRPPGVGLGVLFEARGSAVEGVAALVWASAVAALMVIRDHLGGSLPSDA